MPSQRLLTTILLAILLLSGCSDVVYSYDWREQHLTQEERSFLKEHPVLKAGVGIAFPPIMFVHGQEPAFKGMVSDYIQIIENRLQVDIQPILEIPFKEALARAEAREIDIFPCIAETVERKEFLSFTAPYLSYPLVIITREDEAFVSGIEDLTSLRVAIIKPLATYSKLQNDFKKIKFHYVFQDSIPDVLKAVSLGNADACIVNLAVAAYEINRLGLSNLKVAAPTPWTNNKLAMAVRSDWHLLKSILEKAIQSISAKEHSDIQGKWININIPTPFDYAGTLKWVLITFSLIAVAFIATTFWIRSLKKEISRRLQAEKMLKESETSLILAAEKNGLHLWDWNLQTDCIHFKTYDNRQSDSCMTNYKPIWLKAIHKEDVEAVENAFEECLTGKSQKISLEYRKLTDEGHATWEHMAAVAITDDSGVPNRLLGLFQDVTTGKELLKKRALSEKLESIGEIAAGIAHEVNTPLHYVKGNLKYIAGIIEKMLLHSTEDHHNLDLLIKKNNEAKQSLKECVVAAYESIEGVERISKVMNALKLVAHISDKQVNRYNLRDILDKALTISENEWRYSSVVELDIYKDLMVVCNPGDLIQLTTVHLVNAAQAIKERYGSAQLGKIKILAHAEGTTLILDIADNGVGMDKATTVRVFDPFFTTKTASEGTGQGLYIASNIAKKYGGSISCTSTLNEGTVFTFSLPEILSLKSEG